MENAPSRAGRIIRDLALACLNATLVLVLLCLLVWYLAANKMEAVAHSLARSAAVVTPLRQDVATMTGTLADLRVAVTEPDTAITPQLQAQMGQLHGRLDALQGQLEGMSLTPALLLDHAIEKAALEVRRTVQAWRSCAPQGSAGAD